MRPCAARGANLLCMKIVRILLAIFLPPIAVFLQRGISGQFFLNILLTLCFGLPGSIHALYLMLKEQ